MAQEFGSRLHKNQAQNYFRRTQHENDFCYYFCCRWVCEQSVCELATHSAAQSGKKSDAQSNYILVYKDLVEKMSDRH